MKIQTRFRNPARTRLADLRVVGYSGSNGDLLKVRWKRFACGMFEPFGIKVVDGLIYVTIQYTDYKLPGAIITVSPDGKTRDVVQRHGVFARWSIDGQ